MQVKLLDLTHQYLNIRREVRKVIDGKVTATELEKAKNFVITAALRRRETTLGKGSPIRDAIVYHHDASYANKRLDRLQAVTAADVQRVAKTYFGGKPVVITYTSGAPASTPAGHTTSRRGRAGTPAIQPAGRRRSESSGGAK